MPIYIVRSGRVIRAKSTCTNLENLCSHLVGTSKPGEVGVKERGLGTLLVTVYLVNSVAVSVCGSNIVLL